MDKSNLSHEFSTYGGLKIFKTKPDNYKECKKRQSSRLKLKQKLLQPNSELKQKSSSDPITKSNGRKRKYQLGAANKHDVKISLNQHYLTLNSTFFEAVTQQDKLLVATLIDQGADVNYNKCCNTMGTGDVTMGTGDVTMGTGDVDGDDFCHVLQLAIELKNISLVRTLIENGADVNLKSKANCPKSSPIVHAVICSTFEIVNLLCENRASVNDLVKGKLSMYSYALYYALCHTKPLELVKLLLDMGANINTPPAEQSTYGLPLMTAIEYSKDIRVVQLLVGYGADINAKNSVLVRSIELNFIDKAKFLLEKGVHLYLRNKVGKCPLGAALASMTKAGLTLQNLPEDSLIPLLIKKGSYWPSTLDDAIISCPEMHMHFKKKGKTLLTRLLLWNPCEFDRYDIDGYLLKLLSSGANFEFVSEVDGMECYAVHRSIAAGDLDILNTLISSGEFAPMLMTQGSKFCIVRYHTVCKTVVSALFDVLSPLCVALLTSQYLVAERMIEHNYLTMSDLTFLPKNEIVRACLIHNDESLDILDSLCQSPLSLFKLCAVRVSDCIGSNLGRKQRISRTGLPLSIQRTLLYDTNTTFLTYREHLYFRDSGSGNILLEGFPREFKSKFHLSDPDFEFQELESD